MTASEEPTAVRERLVERTLPDLRRTCASVFARDLRNEAPLLAYDATVPRLPASNAKLITAARGFVELGPGYRYETAVHPTGTVRDGELLGDLVIVGGGDPDLSQSDLLTLADRIADGGIDTVVGAITVDASAFDEQTLGPGWTWDDSQFTYGAKSTPLALGRNTVDITVSHRNGTIDVDVSPKSQIVRTEVDVAGKLDDEVDLEVFKRRASEVIQVEGTIPPGETVVRTSPVDDPMFHAVSLFKRALAEKGVEVSGWINVESKPVKRRERPIATVESAPLAVLTERMLHRSDNFYAEQLARTVAREVDGRGTWEAWEAHVTEFVRELGHDAVRLRDGSGLSRYDLVSAAAIVDVLDWCLEQSWASEYYESLPRCGKEGTVENRLPDVSAGVRAKTGTLTGARALSGFIEDQAGEPAIAFSILTSSLTGVSEANATKCIDDLVQELVRCSDLAI